MIFVVELLKGSKLLNPHQQFLATNATYEPAGELLAASKIFNREQLKVTLRRTPMLRILFP